MAGTKKVNKDYELKKLRELVASLYGIVCDMGLYGMKPDMLDRLADCKRTMDKLGINGE